MKTFRITEILDWTEDSYLMDGDASHEGYDAVEELLVEERRLMAGRSRKRRMGRGVVPMYSSRFKNH